MQNLFALSCLVLGALVACFVLITLSFAFGILPQAEMPLFLVLLFFFFVAPTTAILKMIVAAGFLVTSITISALSLVGGRMFGVNSGILAILLSILAIATGSVIFELRVFV